MTDIEFKKALKYAAKELQVNTTMLSELDAIAGDGDHGITIGKIADIIMEELETSMKPMDELLDDCGWKFMSIGGGSAASLWGTLFMGFAKGLDGKKEFDETALESMFTQGLMELGTISKATEGDKTMMDALIPAVNALRDSDGGLIEKLEAASSEAMKGTEKTKDYQAKYGRAKNLGERSIGHKDPGATSTAIFIKGMYLGAIQ
ncbi:dihydroxyacetone kinase subunit DhaL [Vallitalea okinawensis]|uniref:dihydroxyacetone kinase subunit DhaL n=1 Tax=Vallitalea okinawensis TaxID=2078660 RepID=UPI001300AC1D|nr:dihydroxyacetone kinase subunit DhaL [Vallitalea okinawensis]